MDDRGAAALRDARDAHARRDWPRARAAFHSARDSGAELSADDLEALGDCAWWLGLGDETVETAGRAYRLFLEQGSRRQAAMSAVGVAMVLFMRGDETLGTAWAGRAQRLLADEPDCVEHGYLLYGEVEGALEQADLDAALTGARRLQDLGRRHGDPALVTLGVLAEGRVLVRQGSVHDGMALLDESMLVAVSDELPPAFTGNIYCHLVAACWELGDLRRARDWTTALDQWLARLPAAVVFGGVCQVHRAQLLQLHGDWRRAEEQAQQACADVVAMHLAPAAEGWYTVGDLRRLRGDLAGADAAYAAAHRLGRDPQPGRALLLLARGQHAAAAASARAALAAEQRGPLQRAPLLAAQVDIALAAGDSDGAAAAAAELDTSAATYGGAGIVAAAGRARGAVLLAHNDAAGALSRLRAACGLWSELDAPYDMARTRVLLARAYRALGDDDAAALELDVAEETFHRLSATPDAVAVPQQRARPALPGRLTPREVEVLALVATGRTNREVAGRLVLSERTVERHLTNILGKLGLTSRTAAAAYAFEHGLVPPAVRGTTQP